MHWPLRRSYNRAYIPGVMPKKLADHGYVRLMLLGKHFFKQFGNSWSIEIIDNKVFNQKVHKVDLNALVPTNHLELYRLKVWKLQALYNIKTKTCEN